MPEIGVLVGKTNFFFFLEYRRGLCVLAVLFHISCFVIGLFSLFFSFDAYFLPIIAIKLELTSNDCNMLAISTMVFIGKDSYVVLLLLPLKRIRKLHSE